MGHTAHTHVSALGKCVNRDPLLADHAHPLLLEVLDAPRLSRQLLVLRPQSVGNLLDARRLGFLLVCELLLPSLEILQLARKVEAPAVVSERVFLQHLGKGGAIGRVCGRHSFDNVVKQVRSIVN